MSGTQLEVLKQHLIDPEVCIRCNTCEETCPVNAITHDSANYVVNADLCNFCMACISPCPTGSIDNWRTVLRSEPYSVEEQLTWGELPAQGTIAVPTTSEGDAASAPPPKAGPASAANVAPTDDTAGEASGIEVDVVRGSVVPPWSAARPYVNLYTHKAPITATCAGNYRLTADGIDNDVRHIVLDFGQMPFPVLEGQSIAVLPPGETAAGRAHHARQYSIASARDGERRGYNNLSLTVKRVTASDKGDGDGGVCSNYLCDLKKGDQVQVIGPFGATFLMPNHPGSHLLMICTGTGSAPMRAMTEYRRRRRAPGKGGATGKLMLFFGARTKEELPYFGPLMNLPKDFIDVNFAFSRTPGQPRTYVQDVMKKRAADIAAMLRDDSTYIYVCGLKGMEEGVIQVLGEIANDSGQPWEPLWKKLKDMGRLHFETY
jgi:benzoyl-CoA oxygenase/reductase BoxA protein